MPSGTSSRVEITLPRTADAARRARRFVARTCAAWGVPALTLDAETVASELVENTLQHTDSPARVRLELRAGELTVAVWDNRPDPAHVRPSRRRFGLVMVDRTARSWGCAPAPAGGKIVWARLAAEPSAATLGSR